MQPAAQGKGEKGRAAHRKPLPRLRTLPKHNYWLPGDQGPQPASHSRHHTHVQIYWTPKKFGLETRIVGSLLSRHFAKLAPSLAFKLPPCPTRGFSFVQTPTTRLHIHTVSKHAQLFAVDAVLLQFLTCQCYFNYYGRPYKTVHIHLPSFSWDHGMVRAY